MIRRPWACIAIFVLLVSAEASGKTKSIPAESDRHGIGDLRVTQVFTQFNFYDTDSDRDQLRFRYRAYGFSSGFGFTDDRRLSGYLFGGYTNAVDRISSAPQSRTFYDLPQIGGMVRYSILPDLFVGTTLSVQPVLGRFKSLTDRGRKDGWSVSGMPFVSATVPLRPIFIDLTAGVNLSYVGVEQPGPSDGFVGSAASAKLSVGARYVPTRDLSIGVSVTPAWVLAESDRISNRGNGPLFVTFGGQARVRISGPLWVYGGYNYSLHRPGRSAQSAVIGFALTLGR